MVIAWYLGSGNVTAFGEDYFSGESFRSKRWEMIFTPQYTLAKNLGFDGGTTAQVDDTMGFGL